MAITITGTFAPSGPFGLVNDTDIKGSYQIVSDSTERDNIPEQKRKWGMLVYSQSDDIIYKLKNVNNIITDNNNWVEFTTSTTSSDTTDTSTTDTSSNISVTSTPITVSTDSTIILSVTDSESRLFQVFQKNDSQSISANLWDMSGDDFSKSSQFVAENGSLEIQNDFSVETTDQDFYKITTLNFDQVKTIISIVAA